MCHSVSTASHLDLVGGVRNDLDRLTEVVSTTLLLNDTLVHLSRGDVVVTRELDVQEALIVTEVEIRFASVSEHIHLSVLVGTHCSSVAILQFHLVQITSHKVRINLNRSHLHSMRLQQQTKTADRDSLTQTTQNSTGNNEILHLLFARNNLA